tara:strand:- start:8 stop:187 length:180 start_codon:yes stop_codon:yes gene_type:complete
MTKDLHVTIKNNYGTEDVYPECETSTFFARLARQKTLTPSTIAMIKKEGYTLTISARRL